MPFASRSQRLLGQILDGFVGFAPLFVALLLLGVSDMVGVVALGAAGFWAVFYYFFADGLAGGGSYGKRWLGMRCIHEASGTPCTFGQSFIRNLLLYLLGPIDWIFIFGERHQRLGDKAAGTVVVVG